MSIHAATTRPAVAKKTLMIAGWNEAAIFGTAGSSMKNVPAKRWSARRRGKTSAARSSTSAVVAA